VEITTQLVLVPRFVATAITTSMTLHQCNVMIQTLMMEMAVVKIAPLSLVGNVQLVGITTQTTIHHHHAPRYAKME